QLYMGTPHTYHTIYGEVARAGTGEDRPFLAGFRRLALPLLTPAGASRWPERFPPERIAALRERSGPNKFRSQMLLRPVDIRDSRLDPDLLAAYHHELDYAERNGRAVLSLDGRRLVSASCWWDPAYGAPGGGDGSVVVALFTDADGAYWLHRVRYLEHDPARTEVDEATQLCRQVAAFVREMYLQAVKLEINGMGIF